MHGIAGKPRRLASNQVCSSATIDSAAQAVASIQTPPEEASGSAGKASR